MIQVTLSGDTRNTVSGDTSDAQWRYKEQSVVGDTGTASSDTSDTGGDTRSNGRRYKEHSSDTSDTQ